MVTHNLLFISNQENSNEVVESISRIQTIENPSEVNNSTKDNSLALVDWLRFYISIYPSGFSYFPLA